MQGISSTPDYTFYGPSGFNTRRYQFSCYGDTYPQAKRVQEALRLALDGFNGYLPNGALVFDIRRDNEQDLYDNESNSHRIITDFYIDFQELGQGQVSNITQNVAPQLITETYQPVMLIDFSVRNAIHSLTLTGDVEFTFTGGVAGQLITLIITQDGVGGHQITSWSPNITSGVQVGQVAGASTALQFLFDGANYLLLNAPISSQ
jgi:hypothetical protein